MANVAWSGYALRITELKSYENKEEWYKINLHNLFSLISTDNTPNLCKNHRKDPGKRAILGFYTIFFIPNIMTMIDLSP